MNPLLQLKYDVICQLEQSNSFPKKEIYFDMLRYMVDEEGKGREAKSSAMAIDLLLDKESENEGTPIRDSYIRAQILALRKELDLFFTKEGDAYEHKIIIPKRRYIIELQSTALPTATMPLDSTGKQTLWLKLALLVLGLCFVGSLFFIYTLTKDTSNDSFVSLLINMEERVDIVLGDRSFYLEYDQELDRNRFIFDTEVALPHTSKEFMKMQNKYPKRKLLLAQDFSHTDIGNMYLASELIAECTQKGGIYRLFQSSQKKEIDANTVFISKTSSGDLYKLFSHYFIQSKSNFSGSESHKSFIESFSVNDSTYYFKTRKTRVNNKDVRSSYCLIKKTITMNGDELLFILAGNDVTRKYLLEKLYDKTFLLEIKDSFEGDVPDEFELLLEVKGSRFKAATHKVIYNSSST